MPTYARLGRVATYVQYADLRGTENRAIRFAAPTARMAWVERHGEVHVFYHEKHLVCFNRDQICIRNNAHHRFMTKVRMNQAANQFQLGFKVYQRGTNWFVEWRGETLPFTDGLILNRRAANAPASIAGVDNAYRVSRMMQRAIQDGQGPES